jgi:predicted ribosome quality control (RQC) complex YloA/Tae2 family protein
MPLDGLFTHATARELNNLLIGGRISKVHQPYSNEIILVIRNNGTNYPLLLSAHPTFARAQITRIPYENPQTAPNFVMLLRRYLEGAKLQSITQLANDRILNFVVNARDELGDLQPIRLTLEMMGRHSNLFLVREKDERILELIKHVPADQNRVRSLYPGATYALPPQQTTLLNPFTTDAQAFAQLALTTPYETLAQTIQRTYQGFSRESAQSLADALSQSGDAAQHAREWFAHFEAPHPAVMKNDAGKYAFAPFDYGGDWTVVQSYATLGELLDAYYIGQAERDRVNQQAGNLVRLVKNELKKQQSKQKKLHQTLDDANNADQYKVMADLLMTYPHLTKDKGQKTITLDNYYDDNQPLTIPLDPRFNGMKNAEKYYQRYRKLRNAIDYVHEQLALSRAEIDYFETILAQLDVASPKDVADIRAELIAEGYLRQQKKNKQRPKVSQPDLFIAPDGTKIEVGKNNLQNDRLSLKQADRRDIWLHVQKMPGSHVIIHDANPSDETLHIGAQLAAYYSKARQSANVPVDYLPAGKLRKPNGAKPGFVIFEGHQTLYVTPDEQLIASLRG